MVQLGIDDDKLSTADGSEEEDDTGTGFWNESANETNSEEEEEGGEDIEEEDLDGEQSQTEQKANPEISMIEMKWNKEGEQNLRGGYGKGSKSSQMRHNKSVRDLEREASRT